MTVPWVNKVPNVHFESQRHPLGWTEVMFEGEVPGPSRCRAAMLSGVGLATACKLVNEIAAATDVIRNLCANPRPTLFRRGRTDHQSRRAVFAASTVATIIAPALVPFHPVWSAAVTAELFAKNRRRMARLDFPSSSTHPRYALKCRPSGEIQSDRISLYSRLEVILAF